MKKSHFSFVLLLAFAFNFQSAAHAQNIKPLLSCVPSIAQGTEEASAKAQAKEAGLSNKDILARLIFSEALSSGYWAATCRASSAKDLLIAIGWGTMNRVRLANGNDPYYQTIFARNQFRTSFSKKEIVLASGKSKQKQVNPFAVSFLCPQSSRAYFAAVGSKVVPSQVFIMADQVAGEIIATYEKTGIPATYKGITNFFYPYSEFFGQMRPAWAKDPDPTKNRGYRNLLRLSKPCAEFYSL